jgi:hypothetical protein
MPATVMMTRAALQPFTLRQQAMETRHSDVVQAIDDVAHDFCRD